MQIIIDTNTKYFQNYSLNRGLQTFTSFISDQRKMIFLDEHLERLLKGANWLFPNENWELRKNEIKDFLQTEWKAKSYFRLMIFDDKLIFSQGEWLPKSESLKLTVAQTLKTPNLVPPYVKTPSYLVAEAELKKARLQGFDDVLFLGPDRQVCEGSTSNVFVVLGSGQIITPQESSMVLSGVMRRKVIEFLKKNHYHVEVRELTVEQMATCKEVWMTNAVSGIRVCSHFEDKLLSDDLYQKVCQQFGRFGECYE